jgi:hypothetical protein
MIEDFGEQASRKPKLEASSDQIARNLVGK